MSPGNHTLTNDTDWRPADLTDHDVLAGGLIFFTALLFVSTLGAHLLHRYEFSLLPESALFVALGIPLGILWRVNFGIHTLKEYFGQINTIVLNLLLLPPIIFESGWSVPRGLFFSQAAYICIFAVFGTLISTFVMTDLLHRTELISDQYTAFTFASLISAVDPVATLSTYSALNVEPFLNIMVFGESLINDAVAIALFKTGNEIISHAGDKDAFTVEHVAMRVVVLILGSAFVGFVIGLLFMVVVHVLDVTDEYTSKLILIVAYFCYAVAEEFHMSGIIATLFCGMVVKRGVQDKVSSGAVAMTEFSLKNFASFADQCVFIFVGIAVVLEIENHQSFVFACIVATFCVVARAVAIFPLGLLVNGLKTISGWRRGVPKDEWYLLSLRHQIMMWHAGLRGGIAMALVLEIEITNRDMQAKLEETTCFVICLFLIIFGGSTKFLLGYMQIPMGIAHEPSMVESQGSQPHDRRVPGRRVRQGRTFVSFCVNAVLSPLNANANQRKSLAHRDDAAAAALRIQQDFELAQERNRVDTS